MNALIAEHISCIRGHRMLFEDLSFSAQDGDLLWLRGANGSGKTSLLRIMAGLLPAHSGTIRFETKNNDRIPLHWLGSTAALPESLTVAQALTFWAGTLGLKKGTQQNAVIAALSDWGLEHLAAVPVRYLSTGQKQCTALARLSLQARPFWLLDEPFSRLDTANANRLHNALTKHLDTGGIAVIATHIPAIEDRYHKASFTVLEMEAYL